MPRNTRRSPRYGTLSLTAAALTAAVIGLSPNANATDDDDDQHGSTSSGQSTGTGSHQANDRGPGHRGPGLHDRRGPHRSDHSAEPKRKHRDKVAEKPAGDKSAADTAPGDTVSAASPAGPDTSTHTPTTAPHQDSPPTVAFTPPPPPKQDPPPAAVVVMPPTIVQGEGTLATGPQQVAGSLPTTGVLPPGQLIPIESTPKPPPEPPEIKAWMTGQIPSYRVPEGVTITETTHLDDRRIVIVDSLGRIYVFDKKTEVLQRVSERPQDIPETPVQSPTLQSPLSGLIGPPLGPWS